MHGVGDTEPTWISWEEASRLTHFRTPTIEHAVRVGRIVRRPARGVLPTLDRESVLAWAEWQREAVAQRAARRRENTEPRRAGRCLRDALRPQDQLLGPPREGAWLSLPAAAQRLNVTTVTVRRWLEAGRLDGVNRSERWVNEPSLVELEAERQQDAAIWISLAAAADIIGCSIKTIPGLVAEGLIERREGPRSQASIKRVSAEQAGRVLAERREAVRAERQMRDERRTRHEAPDDGNVWLSVKTTALLLGLSESGVTLKVRAGTLPATRRGRRWWVRREDAEHAAAARVFPAAYRSRQLRRLP